MTSFLDAEKTSKEVDDKTKAAVKRKREDGDGGEKVADKKVKHDEEEDPAEAAKKKEQADAQQKTLAEVVALYVPPSEKEAKEKLEQASRTGRRPIFVQNLEPSWVITKESIKEALGSKWPIVAFHNDFARNFETYESYLAYVKNLIEPAADDVKAFAGYDLKTDGKDFKGDGKCLVFLYREKHSARVDEWKALVAEVDSKATCHYVMIPDEVDETRVPKRFFLMPEASASKFKRQWVNFRYFSGVVPRPWWELTADERKSIKDKSQYVVYPPYPKVEWGEDGQATFPDVKFNMPCLAGMLGDRHNEFRIWGRGRFIKFTGSHHANSFNLKVSIALVDPQDPERRATRALWALEMAAEEQLSSLMPYMQGMQVKPKNKGKKKADATSTLPADPRGERPDCREIEPEKWNTLVFLGGVKGPSGGGKQDDKKKKKSSDSSKHRYLASHLEAPKVARFDDVIRGKLAMKEKWTDGKKVPVGLKCLFFGEDNKPLKGKPTDEFKKGNAVEWTIEVKSNCINDQTSAEWTKEFCLLKRLDRNENAVDDDDTSSFEAATPSMMLESSSSSSSSSSSN